MAETGALHSLLQWLAEEGFPEADLESEGDLLILKLEPPHRARFFGDADLRRRLVAQARAAGFTRVALELFGGVAQPGRAGDS